MASPTYAIIGLIIAVLTILVFTILFIAIYSARKTVTRKIDVSEWVEETYEMILGPDNQLK
jgi:hypothetical protein